jgi:hypothetical protein
MKKWLEKKCNSPVKVINSVDELELFNKENQVAAIGLFKVKVPFFDKYIAHDTNNIL